MYLLKRFAHIASHDLKEPLRGIANCLGLLETLLEERLQGEPKEVLDHAVSAAQRMQKMIEGLLAYSTLGRELPAAKSVDLDEVVRTTLADLGVTGAKVEELPRVEGHLTLIQRLFHNLVSNSIKYRAPNRDLQLRIGCRDGIFSVADNGIGIEAKFHHQIFELFRRLHPHAKIQGTGLGLTLCQKIVDFHGGRIWIESTPGQGSTFFFTLSPAPPRP